MLLAFLNSNLALHLSLMPLPPEWGIYPLLSVNIFLLLELEQGFAFEAAIVVHMARVVVSNRGAYGGLDMVASPALPHLIMRELIVTEVARVFLCHC